MDIPIYFSHTIISPEKLLEFGLVQVDEGFVARNPPNYLRHLSSTPKGLNRYMAKQEKLCVEDVQISNHPQYRAFRSKDTETAAISLTSYYHESDQQYAKKVGNAATNRLRRAKFDLSSSDNALPSLHSLASI